MWWLIGIAVYLIVGGISAYGPTRREMVIRPRAPYLPNDVQWGFYVVVRAIIWPLFIFPPPK